MACPVVATLTGIIAVADLRNQIGDPTLASNEAGWISDDMLCAIIQRHHDEAVTAADLAILAYVLQAGNVGPDQLYDEVALSEVTTDITGLAMFDLDLTTFWPHIQMATQLTTAVSQLAEDDDLIGRLTTDFFARDRFQIIDDRIFVLPVTAVTITISIANLARTRDFHVGGPNGILAVNALIIKDASVMLAARIKEGNRLADIISAIDGTVSGRQARASVDGTPAGRAN